MIKVNLYVVGTLKEKYLQEAANEYIKRISRFAKVTIVEIKEENLTDPQQTSIRESSKILQKVTSKALLMDSHGQMLDSQEFADKINKMICKGEEINFIIGGSNGVDDRVKDRFESISFGRITYPHQLVRVVLLEQIYRAFTIINNIVYHK